ncbi:MAG: folate-binding protein YgfZ, partial [Gammaproteobacteria bacterium]
NGYILITPRSMVLDLMQSLHRYVVQAKVSLADASAHFSRFIVQTDNRQIIETPLLPAEPGMVYQDDDLISLQLESLTGERRYLLLYLSEQLAIAQWSSWTDQLSAAGFQAFRLSEINAGIPVIYAQTSEAFVLQMSNLNVLNGVSFKKGCYPGQEIVARMQYLGKLKRRMFLARLETSKLPLPGDDVVVQGKISADGSGKVVDAELDENGGCRCLYIAQINKAENGQLELLEQPGIVFENVDLPYSIDN